MGSPQSSYEKLYRGAWENFRLYWKEGKVDCKVEIYINRMNNVSELNTYVIIRNKVIHVHMISQVKSGEGDFWDKMLLWRMALKELLNAGAANIYRTTVMIERDKVREQEMESVILYPLKPEECLKKK